MPIERVKKKVKKAAKKVRKHWSFEEKQRRADMAEVMQMQLMTALGFQPAPAVKS